MDMFACELYVAPRRDKQTALGNWPNRRIAEVWIQGIPVV